MKQSAFPLMLASLGEGHTLAQFEAVTGCMPAEFKSILRFDKVPKQIASQPSRHWPENSRNDFKVGLYCFYCLQGSAKLIGWPRFSHQIGYDFTHPSRQS